MSENPMDQPVGQPVEADHPEVEAYWVDARIKARLNPAGGYFGPGVTESLPPPAWSFGATPAQAERLLGLVLDGVKTATSSALWDYEAQGDPLPEPGDLSIILDGAGHPRALISCTAVRVVPFAEVDEEHAAAEGEGDRSLRHWRREHERFFSEQASHGREFSPDMPVVLEHFRVLVPTRSERSR